MRFEVDFKDFKEFADMHRAMLENLQDDAVWLAVFAIAIIALLLGINIVLVCLARRYGEMAAAVRMDTRIRHHSFHGEWLRQAEDAASSMAGPGSALAVEYETYNGRRGAYGPCIAVYAPDTAVTDGRTRLLTWGINLDNDHPLKQQWLVIESPFRESLADTVHYAGLFDTDLRDLVRETIATFKVRQGGMHDPRQHAIA